MICGSRDRAGRGFPPSQLQAIIVPGGDSRRHRAFLFLHPVASL
jgi:hypothetical protein